MSNYFDNQKNWSWNTTDGRVTVTTDHGSHTHTLDVTNVPVKDMAEQTGKVMGDAHRRAAHDFKENNVKGEKPAMNKNEAFRAKQKCSNETIAKTNQVGRSFAARVNKSYAKSLIKDDGGKERGDDRTGRENGNKVGDSQAVNVKSVKTVSSVKTASPAISSVKTASVHSGSGKTGSGKGHISSNSTGLSGGGRIGSGYGISGGKSGSTGMGGGKGTGSGLGGHGGSGGHGGGSGGHGGGFGGHGGGRGGHGGH